MKRKDHSWESWPEYLLGADSVSEVRTVVRCRSCGADRKKSRASGLCQGPAR